MFVGVLMHVFIRGRIWVCFVNRCINLYINHFIVIWEKNFQRPSPKMIIIGVNFDKGLLFTWLAHAHCFQYASSIF